MTHEPRTQEEVYNSLRNSLIGKIAKLTNFTDRSFNYVWTQAFSEEVRELEVKALVSEFAGFIDYTGGPITDEQLADLGLDDEVTAEEVNELMEDQYLDEYVKIVGVSRDPGSKATGEVNFVTQTPATTIPAGTRVTTPPDSNGETIDFLTTQVANTVDGETQVNNVPIEAVDVGTEFNVSAGTISRISNPPVGVRSVNNPISTTGGENKESNAELRERAKNAVGGASEGGTVEGIKAYISNNIDGVDQGDVIVDEFLDAQPTYVDVIVDGGLDAEVDDAIQFSRPAGIQHNLVRPEVVNIGVESELSGTDISISDVTSAVSDFLLKLGIGDEFYRDALIREIMTSDDDIVNIERLDTVIESVENETFLYDTGQTDYTLDYTYESTNGSITVTDTSGDTYSEGSDFTVEDQTGDGWPETLVWGGGTTPDDAETFFVSYDVTVPGDTKNGDKYGADLVRDEIFTFNLGQQDTLTYDTGRRNYQLSYSSFDGTVSIVDSTPTTYYKDINWQLAPLTEGAETDVFTYTSGTSDYALASDYLIGDIAIFDDDDRIYVEGSDYDVIDVDGNGNPDTVTWDVDIDGAVADDGGATTDETTAANNSTVDDMTLLPASPAAGDAYYFGQSEIFGGLDLNISTAGSGTWSVVWEYYDGASWVALNNVTDGTNAFRNSGVNTVTFDKESDWATTSVGGVAGLYWVRARLDTFTSLTTQPLGQEVDIGLTPAANVDFTVNYNGFARTVRWDRAYPTPDNGETFTATYDQNLYPTKYEIVETPEGIIRDASGDVYDEDTEYNLVDLDNDSESEAIQWNTNPGTLADDEEFYLTYFTEGDIFFSDRQKGDPGQIDVTVEQ